MKDKKRLNVLRAALRNKYGSGRYRITQYGMVHIYSAMPNNGNIGWWLMGDILQAELWMGFYNEVAA